MGLHVAELATLAPARFALSPPRSKYLSAILRCRESGGRERGERFSDAHERRAARDDLELAAHAFEERRRPHDRVAQPAARGRLRGERGLHVHLRVLELPERAAAARRQRERARENGAEKNARAARARENRARALSPLSASDLQRVVVPQLGAAHAERGEQHEVARARRARRVHAVPRRLEVGGRGPKLHPRERERGRGPRFHLEVDRARVGLGARAAREARDHDVDRPRRERRAVRLRGERRERRGARARARETRKRRRAGPRQRGVDGGPPRGRSARARCARAAREVGRGGARSADLGRRRVAHVGDLHLRALKLGLLLRLGRVAHDGGRRVAAAHALAHDRLADVAARADDAHALARAALARDKVRGRAAHARRGGRRRAAAAAARAAAARAAAQARRGEARARRGAREQQADRELHDSETQVGVDETTP